MTPSRDSPKAWLNSISNTVILITAYKAQPDAWNNHPDPVKVAEAWERISRNVRLPVVLLKQEIANLRREWERAHDQVCKHGSIQLWYYQMLAFIEPFILKRKRRGRQPSPPKPARSLRPTPAPRLPTRPLSRSTPHHPRQLVFWQEALQLHDVTPQLSALSVASEQWIASLVQELPRDQRLLVMGKIIQAAGLVASGVAIDEIFPTHRT